MRESPATDTELQLEPLEPFETSETLGATVIVLNLWQVNNLPPLPTRFCVKIAGPPGIFTLIITATITSTGHKTSKPISETNRSNNHFSTIPNLLFFIKLHTFF